MNVFSLRDRVIEDYRGYVQSFLRIADPRIAEFVAGWLDEGALWPDPCHVPDSGAQGEGEVRIFPFA
jgi:hypothetical protein